MRNNELSASGGDENDVEMVELWRGRKLEKAKHGLLMQKAGSQKQFVTMLLRMLHSPMVLASSSLTGKICNAQKGATPKACLSEIDETIEYASVQTKAAKSMIRKSITVVLNVEAKK